LSAVVLGVAPRALDLPPPWLGRWVYTRRLRAVGLAFTQPSHPGWCGFVVRHAASLPPFGGPERQRPAVLVLVGAAICDIDQHIPAGETDHMPALVGWDVVAPDLIGNVERFWCKRQDLARYDVGRAAGGVGMSKLMGVEQLFEGRHFDREVIILCVRWYRLA
jgi:hypothetical protein